MGNELREVQEPNGLLHVKVLGKKTLCLYLINENRNCDGRLLKRPDIVQKKAAEEDIELFWADIYPGSREIIHNGETYLITSIAYDEKNDCHCAITNYTEEGNLPDSTVKRLSVLTQEWNEQEINGSERMMAWCRLHNREPKYVCVEDLKKVLGISHPLLSITTDAIKIPAGGIGISNAATHVHDPLMFKWDT